LIELTTKGALPNRPGRQVLRFALFTLTVLLVLAGMLPVNAASAQQTADSPALPRQAGTEDRGAVAGNAAPGADNPGSLPADSGGAGQADNNNRRDLTIFFSIGVIVNILMLAAFLYWAVGQWSRSKK